MPNFGDQIVKQYMNRTRWFVPASTVSELAEKILIHCGVVEKGTAPDSAAIDQVAGALAVRMRRGEIRTCKRAGSNGYRKASGREVQKFKRRGLPSHKSHPVRTHAASRKRKVATAPAT